MRTYTSQPIDIPRDLNLTELLHTTATSIPESHIIASDSLTNRSITLGELRDRAGRIAKGLKDGLNPPDQARWAIVLPNSVEFLEMFHAILWTGGVVSPVNHALKSSEIGHGFAVSRPHFIVAYGPITPAIQDAVAVAVKELSTLGVQWDSPTILSIIKPARGVKHIPDDFIASSRLAIPHWPDTSRRLASIHLSSGTTGKPKGVELTHLNFVSNVLQLVALDEKHQMFNVSSRTVAFTPWAHIAMTTVPLFLGPYTGMFHHAMPQYSIDKFGQLVGSNQATSFQGVPSVVLSLANSDVTERFDFSKAQIINIGGAPLKPEQIERLLRRAPWKLIQAYGMTEAAGYVAYQAFDEKVPDGSTGRLLPGIEAALKKEGTTEDAPEGGPGELWIRGPNITRGYAFNPKANQEAFRMEGWYNTGDVCRFDREGRLFIVGRTKDLIKYKGFQVSPSELEQIVNSHPLVKEAGVGALWDETQLTEVPTAWVALKDGDMMRREEIRRRLRDIHKVVDNQALRKLSFGAQHALTKEPGTSKYAIFLSRDPEKQNTIYVVEEYPSKADFDAHMALPHVQKLVSWMSATNPSPLAGTPSTHFLSLPSDDFLFSRAKVSEHKEKDPWVIIAELGYRPGGSETSIPYWQGVVNEGRENEGGTLVYGLARDSEDSEKLWTVEVYESEAYLKDVHVKSKAIAESIKNTKHLRTGLTWTFLSWKDGFLHKDN
ncbi:AMP-binding enzyme [Colletotrichum gloeosporioides Cg-14]|uniref:AMP-binding enzyme n=1 Tax=Colletotrichum gloeosporioides (strain Cg-14) TaxID=1237896 RepID=T0KVX2_COLGC|nr:AMP-binding enzyme [Colletotrichum gloeosporioides Cg-14]